MNRSITDYKIAKEYVNMKKRICILFSFLTLTYFLFSPINVKASIVKSASCSDRMEKSHTFMVAGGGFSYIGVEVYYLESCSSNGTYNTYYERRRDMMVKTIYVLDAPYAELGNVMHSNNKIFTTWTQNPIIYSPNDWDFGYSYINSESVTYSLTTNVVGTLPFNLRCDGAMGLPILSYSIKLQL